MDGGGGGEGGGSAALYLQNLAGLETMHLKKTKITGGILMVKQVVRTLQDEFVQITFFHMHEDFTIFLNPEV